MIGEYVQVYLGRLNELNESCLYSFPTPQAAARFADFHRERDPGRAVIVDGDQP